MKKTSIFLFGILLFQISFAQKKNKTSTPISKPNILMILVDDYGWRDIHAYGSDFYETPNMDKLISQSMKFTQAYSSYPRCVPSRYSIMTGTNPARIKGNKGGGEDESGFNIDKPNISIGKAMHNAGYKTFYIGKWHLGADEFAPMGVGFDTSIAAGAAGATSSHFAPYNVARNGKAAKEAPIPNVENAQEKECLEDRLTDETIKLLQIQNSNQPFFGILAHYAVHTPIQGKPEYVKYFQDKLAKMPKQEGDEYEKERNAETKLKQNNATYAAMIKAVDDGIGKILETLEKQGLDKNTIIIVTSDHGGLASRGNQRELATSNKPLRAGKGHLYEGGIRVPLFVKWQGVIKAGTETNSLVIGADHFNTLLDIAGAKMPNTQTNDGESYINILKGAQANTARTMYWHNPAPRPGSTGDIYSSAIRMGDYKLLDFFGIDSVELYNLKDDIGEHNNIAESNKELKDKMYKMLCDWRNKVGASMIVKAKGTGETDRNAPKKEARKEERKADRKVERKDAKQKTENDGL